MPVIGSTVYLGSINESLTGSRSMSQLRGMTMTDGTVAPTSGPISLSTFRNKTIGFIRSHSLVNVPGSTYVGGTWRNRNFEAYTLPTGFSSTNPSYKLIIRITGSIVYGPQQYGSANIHLTTDGNISSGADTSAGWDGNKPSWWSYNGNTTYSGAVFTMTTVNNGTLTAGQQVNLSLWLYNTYWYTGTITYEVYY